MYANSRSDSKSQMMGLIGWLVSRVLYMLIVGLIVSHRIWVWSVGWCPKSLIVLVVSHRGLA